VKITFHSYIEALGKQQIEYLVKLYEEMFKGLDLAYKFDEENLVFSLEGYNIYALLKSESGIHLFYMPYLNPLPIRVNIELESEEKSTDENTLHVVRIYNGSSTITDLRTNFTNASNISVNEFKLLLYAGLEEQMRQVL